MSPVDIVKYPLRDKITPWPENHWCGGMGREMQAEGFRRNMSCLYLAFKEQMWQNVNHWWNEVTGVWVVHFAIVSTFYKFKIVQSQKKIRFHNFCLQHPKGPIIRCQLCSLVSDGLLSAYMSWVTQSSFLQGRILSIFLIPPPPSLSLSLSVSGPITPPGCLEHTGPVAPADLWREVHPMDHHLPGLGTDDGFCQLLCSEYSPLWWLLKIITKFSSTGPIKRKGLCPLSLNMNCSLLKQ